MIQPLRDAVLGTPGPQAATPRASSVIGDYLAQKTPAPTFVQVAQPLRSGNWQYEVRLVKRLDRIGSVRPRGEFLFVYLELTNISNQNFGIGPHDFEVVGLDNHYDPDISSRVLSLYSGELRLISSLDTYPPGVPFDTVLVFDINPIEGALWLVPKQADGSRIHLDCGSLGCTRK